MSLRQLNKKPEDTGAEHCLFQSFTFLGMLEEAGPIYKWGLTEGSFIPVEQ